MTVQSSVSYSIGAWKKKMLIVMPIIDVWLVEFPKKTKSSAGHVCEESVLSD